VSLLARRAFLLAAVVAAPMVGLSSPSYAMSSKVDATNYTVQCSDVSGHVNWHPTIDEKTANKDIKARVRLTLSGCTASPTQGGAPVTITQGNVSGTVTNASPCQNTVPARGTFKVKWVTSPKLSSGDTIITDGASYFAAPYNYPDFNVYFQFGPQNGSGQPGGSTGSFSGTDGGTNTYVIMDFGNNSPFSDCSYKYGLKRAAVATESGDNSIAKFS
jgi:hypothetical protein